MGAAGGKCCDSTAIQVRRVASRIGFKWDISHWQSPCMKSNNSFPWKGRMRLKETRWISETRSVRSGGVRSGDVTFLVKNVWNKVGAKFMQHRPDNDGRWVTKTFRFVLRFCKSRIRIIGSKNNDKHKTYSSADWSKLPLQGFRHLRKKEVLCLFSGEKVEECFWKKTCFCKKQAFLQNNKCF